MSSSQRNKASILLLGSGGQLGSELLPLLAQHAHVVAPRSAELDMADGAAVRSFIRNVQPGWIVNAAAYTAVDRAESEPALAFAINAEAVCVLGEEARALGAPVIHYSTDYVFDGAATGPRCESDPTGPLGVYGHSKLAGEQALAASGAAHFIFRTSWVYSTHGKNFLLTILKLARERKEVRVVADQLGAPTFARDLAQLTLHAMRRAEALAVTDGLSPADAVARLGGVYHASDAGETSWFGFAKEFMKHAQAIEDATRFAQLLPIATSDYPTPARRPADSRLDCTLLMQRLGYAMPAWKHSVACAVQELYTSDPAYQALASRTTDARARG